MSEVHRYQVVTMLSAASATIGYDPHGPDVVMAPEFDRVTAVGEALQLDLTQRDEQIATLDLQREAHLRNSQEAERRVGVLEGLLRDASDMLVWTAYRNTERLRRIDRALNPAKPSKPLTCTWSHDGIGIWSGSCGTKWAFTDDGPTENGMHFCHSCGNRLLVEDKGDE